MKQEQVENKSKYLEIGGAAQNTSIVSKRMNTDSEMKRRTAQVAREVGGEKERKKSRRHDLNCFSVRLRLALDYSCSGIN